ncbi:MAG: hypothetical protein QXS93_02760 [Candidatus Micrarchaeia archaeon]
MRVTLIDQNGNVFPTYLRKNLKVEVVKNRDGFVRLKMKHDSLKSSGGSLNLLEKRYLAHIGPNTKQIKITADVLRAVRLVKHIRESYDIEKEKLAKLFEYISNAIMLLERHNKKSKQCEEDLSLAESFVVGTICGMNQARSFYKVLSKAKLEKAVYYIKSAQIAENDFEMNMHLKPASSILYAAKRRLEMRLDSIGNIKNYNLQREMLLRGMRDMYIHRKMLSLAQWLTNNPGTVVDAYLSDINIYNRLLKLQERCMDNYIREGDRFAKFQSDLEALGSSLKQIKGKEKLVDLLREAYVWGVKRFMFDMAYQMFDTAVVYVGVNKPFYIWSQLEKTNDPYTSPVISKLQEVDEHMLSRNPKAALEKVYDTIGFYEKLFKGAV